MVTPLAPLASSITQSLVERLAVHGDRVEGVVDRLRAARGSSSAFGTAASVVRKPSIVAIIGSIMPEPLAMPPIVNARVRR